MKKIAILIGLILGLSSSSFATKEEEEAAKKIQKNYRKHKTKKKAAEKKHETKAAISRKATQANTARATKTYKLEPQQKYANMIPLYNYLMNLGGKALKPFGEPQKANTVEEHSDGNILYVYHPIFRINTHLGLKTIASIFNQKFKSLDHPVFIHIFASNTDVVNFPQVLADNPTMKRIGFFLYTKELPDSHPVPVVYDQEENIFLVSDSTGNHKYYIKELKDILGISNGKANETAQKPKLPRYKLAAIKSFEGDTCRQHDSGSCVTDGLVFLKRFLVEQESYSAMKRLSAHMLKSTQRSKALEDSGYSKESGIKMEISLFAQKIGDPNKVVIHIRRTVRPDLFYQSMKILALLIYKIQHPNNPYDYKKALNWFRGEVLNINTLVKMGVKVPEPDLSSWQQP